jgi:hypothetical protein
LDGIFSVPFLCGNDPVKLGNQFIASLARPIGSVVTLI